MSELRFLGHAGYEVTSGSVHLLVDPWVEGAAFDNGWDPVLPAVEFDAAAVTHLWFSHEHPDHFSVASVKRIPKDRRADVQVIYQTTNDKRVITFLTAQGFQRIREVKSGERVELGDGISLTTVPAPGDGDSCHLLQIGEFRMINFNDCFYETVATIEDAMRALDVKPGVVDLVAAQFSYANWVGNPDEPQRRQEWAEHKLEHLKMQLNTVKPKYGMPFASYVYFSHEENVYLNDRSNPPSVAAAAAASTGAKPILMVPGNVLTLSADGLQAAHQLVDERGAELDEALRRAQSGELPLRVSESVEFDDLLTTVRAGLDRLHAGLSKIDWAIVRLQLRHAAFALTDHPHVLTIGRLTDVQVLPKGSPSDVELSGEALRFAFSNDFGFDTLLVNGRFRETRPGGAVAVRKLCGQFGYVRRHQSVLGHVLWKRLYYNPRRMLHRLRGRGLATSG